MLPLKINLNWSRYKATGLISGGERLTTKGDKGLVCSLVEYILAEPFPSTPHLSTSAYNLATWKYPGKAIVQYASVGLLKTSVSSMLESSC